MQDCNQALSAGIKLSLVDTSFIVAYDLWTQRLLSSTKNQLERCAPNGIRIT